MLRSPSPPRPARSGFTLVELLVVIAIIATLVGLLMAAIQAVRGKGDELKVRAEFDKLGQALGSFKSKFNRNVPCTGGGPMGTFRLASAYMDSTGAYYPGYSDASPEIVALRHMFGRIDLRDNGLRRAGAAYAPPVLPATVSPNLASNGVLGTAPVLLDPNQCMVFFLSGGSFNEYLGFATSPTLPFASPATSPGSQRLVGTPFFEGFTKDRMRSPVEWFTERLGNASSQLNGLPNPPSPPLTAANVARWEAVAPNNDTITTVSNEPWFVDPWDTPYFYTAASGIGTGGDYPGMCLIGPFGGKYSGYNRTAGFQLPATTDFTAFPAIGALAFRESTNKFYNHAGFQLLSAGPNGSDVRNDRCWGFGRNPNGTAVFGGGDYSKAKGAGGDDWASFRVKPLGSEQ